MEIIHFGGGGGSDLIRNLNFYFAYHSTPHSSFSSTLLFGGKIEIMEDEEPKIIINWFTSCCWCCVPAMKARPEHKLMHKYWHKNNNIIEKWEKSFEDDDNEDDDKKMSKAANLIVFNRFNGWVKVILKKIEINK